MATQDAVLQFRNECEFKSQSGLQQRVVSACNESIQTSIINHGKTIAEPPSWKAEINPIREVVCSSNSWEEVVISIINQRVAKDEHGRGERSSGLGMSKHRKLHDQQN